MSEDADGLSRVESLSRCAVACRRRRVGARARGGLSRSDRGGRRAGAAPSSLSTRAQVMATADAVAAPPEGGRNLALAGVPYALKDLTDTAGLRTTYGSRLREDNVPSARRRRREAACARPAGCCSARQTRRNSAIARRPLSACFRPTRNPWDLSRRLADRAAARLRRSLHVSAPDRRGIGWGRLDPHPVELLRRGRVQAIAGTRLERARTPIRAAG